jgi:hypothetical protein
VLASHNFKVRSKLPLARCSPLGLKAIVSGTATRINSKGDVFDRFGFTYTLRKFSEKWKIIAGVIHDDKNPQIPNSSNS